MTGPEHYREAERLVAGTTIPADPELGDPAVYTPPTPEDLAAAQVHATLALAAATALGEQGFRGIFSADASAWQEAAGTARTGGGRG